MGLVCPWCVVKMFSCTGECSLVYWNFNHHLEIRHIGVSDNCLGIRTAKWVLVFDACRTSKIQPRRNVFASYATIKYYFHIQCDPRVLHPTSPSVHTMCLLLYQYSLALKISSKYSGTCKFWWIVYSMSAVRKVKDFEVATFDTWWSIESIPLNLSCSCISWVSASNSTEHTKQLRLTIHNPSLSKQSLVSPWQHSNHK